MSQVLRDRTGGKELDKTVQIWVCESMWSREMRRRCEWIGRCRPQCTTLSFVRHWWRERRRERRKIAQESVGPESALFKRRLMSTTWRTSRIAHGAPTASAGADRLTRTINLETRRGHENDVQNARGRERGRRWACDQAHHRVHWRAWLRVGENRTQVGSGILREVVHGSCHPGQEGCTNHARVFLSEIFLEQQSHWEGDQGDRRATESHAEPPWIPELGWTSGSPRTYSHGWLSTPRCSFTGTSLRRTAQPHMNTFVGRGPRCSVLSSARASIFGGFPGKADSESSRASGRRDSSFDIGRKVVNTWWPTERELSRRGRWRGFLRTSDGTKVRLRARHGPWKFKTSSGTGS